MVRISGLKVYHGWYISLYYNKNAYCNLDYLWYYKKVVFVEKFDIFLFFNILIIWIIAICTSTWPWICTIFCNDETQWRTAICSGSFQFQVEKEIITMRIEYNPMFTLIKQRHLTLGQVASMAGISRATLNRIYASNKAKDDSYRPSFFVIVRLCKCLHCRVDDVFTIEEAEVVSWMEC